MIRSIKFLICLAFVVISINCDAQNSNIAITNVTVFTEPFQPPVENATILIRNGKFQKIGASKTLKVPANYQIVNGEGKYVTAGYFNSHVHLIEPKWSNAAKAPKDSLETWIAAMLTSRGFVYAFDLAQLDFGNLLDLRGRINSGEINGPSILSVGIPFTSKSPYYILPLKLPELKTETEVVSHIKTQISRGANGIKLWSASPTGKSIDYLSPTLIQEAAKLTGKNNIPLFAHPSNLKGVEVAVENGVTVLAHVAPDDRVVWDSTLLRKMINKKVALIPTLKLFLSELKKEGIEPENNILLSTGVAQLATFSKAGGTVLFGTDVGYMTDYTITDELLCMQKAGMDFHQILASLTVNPAKKFNLFNKTGSIKVGKDADLVLLRKNPSADIQHFTEVEITVHKGKIIFRQP